MDEKSPANEDEAAGFWAEVRSFDRKVKRAQIVAMIRDVLNLSKSGQVTALAIITSDRHDNPSVGYIEGNNEGGLNDGAVFLLNALALAPSHDLRGDEPSRSFGPIKS